MDLGKKWLIDFNAGKTQLVSFDWSINIGAIDVKRNGSVLEDKPSSKMLVLTFSFKLDWVLTLSLLLNCLQENWSLDSLYEVSVS